MCPLILITKHGRGCYIIALLPRCLLVMPCHLFCCIHRDQPQGGLGGGGTPGFECRYDQMWTKIKTQTYPWPFSKTPKISTPNIDPKKPPCRISVTQKCPEIIDTNANYAIGIRGRYHESSDCYEYPPPPPKKNPGIKISNPK